MSNTVITNYTDLNGPTTKADSSVVVIVNKDGSLSVDEKMLGTLMSNDRNQGAGISVVRIGHEGRPDDATDSDTEEDEVPHVTLSVDSYYDEPNSIIKYDSGAEMLHSLRIETREKSLVGFQNDHCYTSLTSPNSSVARSDKYSGFDEPIIEIKTPQLANPVPQSKKIKILEQQIVPKGRKIVLHPTDGVVLKGNDLLDKSLPLLKSKQKSNDKTLNQESDEDEESSSVSTSGESIVDRDSDSDYKDAKDKTSPQKLKRSRTRPRILKSANPKVVKVKQDLKNKLLRINKNIKRDIKDKPSIKNVQDNKIPESPTSQDVAFESPTVSKDQKKETPKPNLKLIRKERKTPSHVTALLSDMTSLFTSPDVIRRISTDGKIPNKVEKEQNRKSTECGNTDNIKTIDSKETLKDKSGLVPKVYTRKDKNAKSLEPMPQIDDVSLAQILQDAPTITTKSQVHAALVKDTFVSSNAISSPGLAGPLSPSLDLLGGLQPEEEGLTEDLLMHVAQLVESSENLQEVIDKQVLGKVDAVSTKSNLQSQFNNSSASSNVFSQTPNSKTQKNVVAPRKDPIEIVTRDGRVITLPPIEAPATRSSKRKSQVPSNLEPVPEPVAAPESTTPEPKIITVSKQYTNKKLIKKLDLDTGSTHSSNKFPIDSEESLNSEDDPNRLWCICKQPHNNRFMICCDSCEDWFHGKCVNITKAMGQQMEDDGIEWTCPNCIKKRNASASKTPKPSPQAPIFQKKLSTPQESASQRRHSDEIKPNTSKAGCIVCKKSARPSSIYCSDACILKHAQDSLDSQTPANKLEAGKSTDKKNESRVIVFERKTGRCLAGPNAPTAENLKIWLQKNPTFEVVRPGTLSTTKPLLPKKPLNEPHKIQTTLNFERIPRKPLQTQTPTTSQQKPESKVLKPPVKETPKSPPPVKNIPVQRRTSDLAKPSTSKAPLELKRTPRTSLIKPRTSGEKTPSTPRRKEKEVEKKSKTNSTFSIRESVRDTLRKEMAQRMSENTTGPKLNEDEIKQFAFDTEIELYELFKDVGVKYKSRYRSLNFNIKDRKNLTLWQKICEKSITPKQLVRLTPEELASQELAEWRDNEAKHQLDLIKKSELDLLAASKTYVLKTHKGEEVMETKTAVSTDLDPNMPVEDVVTALNDSTATEETPTSELGSPDQGGDAYRKSSIDSDKASSGSSRKRGRDMHSSHSKKKETKSVTSDRTSRSSARKRQIKEKEERTRSDKKSRSISMERARSKTRESRRKTRSRERSRHRSRSQAKSKRRSKSRESRSKSHERSTRKERSKSRSRSKHRSRSRRRSSRNKNRSHSKPAETVAKGKRSQSQDNESRKKIAEKREPDVIERPKSAMMKDTHPEYDPHEPMITSAFSDEDLRKSRDDVYEDSLKTDINVTEFPMTEYNPEITTIAPSSGPRTRTRGKKDKLSEGESDQEPSSTVDNSAATVWNGCINMVDVARFYVAAFEVTGSGSDLEEDLSPELDIIGRINHDTVWDYINKMKRTCSKDIVILRLSAANDEEKMQYIALYSYLSSRNRLGVVKVSNTATVKDFYILPLPANEPLPTVLLPIEGPGLEESKSHLLIAIVIRQRKKRPLAVSKEVVPAKISRGATKRSYTPPSDSYTPPRSPRHRAPLPVPAPYVAPVLSSSVKDKIAASLACADEDEAYSPGSASSTGSGPSTSTSTQPSADALRTKMEELNRQIEEQKQQIRKMTQVEPTLPEDEEAYSPSRPMTPPPAMPLADISLPSDLQEILATIKQRTEAGTGAAVAADVDMRTFPPNAPV